MQKQEWISSFWWSAICGREMGKCGVFIPSHSHQAIPIPISIPMKLAWRFQFPWESHGTHGTHGNSQYILISTQSQRRLVNINYATNFSLTCALQSRASDKAVRYR